MPDQIAETIVPTAPTGADPVREELLLQAEQALALRLDRNDAAAGADRDPPGRPCDHMAKADAQRAQVKKRSSPTLITTTRP